MATELSHLVPALIDPTSLEGDQPQKITTETSDGSIVAQTVGFKIHSPHFDSEQFINTSVACAKAGLPLKLVANAGIDKGYKVDQIEVDAGMLGGFRDKSWDIKQSSNMTVIYQHRQAVLNNPQLTAGNSSQQLVPFSEALMVSDVQSEKVDILEGVAVLPDKPSLDEPVQNTQFDDPEQRLNFERILNSAKR